MYNKRLRKKNKKSCTRKKQYSTEEDAKSGLPDNQAIYLCSCCKKFHRFKIKSHIDPNYCRKTKFNSWDDACNWATGNQVVIRCPDCNYWHLI